MNIALSKKETDAQQTSKIAFYVNMHFNKLAEDINNGVIPHQFDGKGRKLSVLTAAQEVTYLFYSSDACGHHKITPPFELNDGDKVACTLQEDPSENSKASFKWQGIVQDCYCLQQVKSKNKDQVTYQAVIDPSVKVETDNVYIYIKFKLNGEKFLVGWDPQVKIKRG